VTWLIGFTYQNELLENVLPSNYLVQSLLWSINRHTVVQENLSWNPRVQFLSSQSPTHNILSQSTRYLQPIRPLNVISWSLNGITGTKVCKEYHEAIHCNFTHSIISVMPKILFKYCVFKYLHTALFLEIAWPHLHP
jgi:hypothetical protein